MSLEGPCVYLSNDISSITIGYYQAEMRYDHLNMVRSQTKCGKIQNFESKVNGVKRMIIALRRYI